MSVQQLPKPRKQPTASAPPNTPAGSKPGLETVIFLCAALIVSVFLHFSAEKFPDPDVFYHFRHAEIYASDGAAGLFRTDFPWVQYSVVNKFSSDIWYGFHLILTPFTWGADRMLNLQAAGIAITFAFLVLFWSACTRLEIRPATVWPFVMLFSSAFVLHRLAILRPHPLSLGLHILLFVFLAAGNIRRIFLTVMVSTFLHLSLFVVSFLILGVFAAIKLSTEKQLPWREGLAVAGGVLAGWALRPNPLGAAQIAYTQVFQFSLEKFAGVALNFGSELQPLTFTARSNYWPFILIWLGTLLYGAWRVFVKRESLPDRARTLLFGSAALSFIFFLMAVLFARRSFELASGFGVLFIGLVFSRFFYERQAARIALICILILSAAYSFSQRSAFLNSRPWEFQRFASVAGWIESNSQPGDIVVNVGWDDFPELFFWNSKNFYIGGMDPIFQYAYDPKRYWAVHHLFTGKMARFTCGAPACEGDNLETTYKVLKEDFRARYVFLVKPSDARLYQYLSSDSRFVLRSEDNNAAVFEIL
jgi:hypothetical protein